ncbi:fungal-specific transcription factor domain-containing protein [Poronia punctata]|nr:fungal-specific transcription factor domain-containing protein [Poronia punctata]
MSETKRPTATTTTTTEAAISPLPPPSAQSQPQSQSQPPVKPTKTLSCVHCQYRKIKCDRRQPCSNCIKAKVACNPSKPAPPHKRRRPNQDLLARLARCEQLLQQYAEGNVPTAKVEAPITPSNASDSVGVNSQMGSPAIKDEPIPESRSTPTGQVVEEDGNVRFMDNFLRLSMYDELAAMRNIVDDDEQESVSSVAATSPENSADLLLGVDDPHLDLQTLQPDMYTAIRLWQIYVERVNPLTKIVHVPSLQEYVLDAATDITSVPLAYQALLFSVYAMAVVTLTNEEAKDQLGMSQNDGLKQFNRGTKLALTRANFLKTYNMTILQALALHMLSLHGRADGHSNWIVGGTILRMAQKMGYHRDGEHFNLDPFETEMRRRLWWFILTQDSKNAMLSGLSQSWVPSNWDTKVPLNLNDADMSSNSREPLVPRDGPTEMAFVLIIYQYQQFQHSTPRAFEAACLALRSGGKDNIDPKDHAAMEKFRSLVEELDLRLAEFERKYVDPAGGGVQEAAAMVRPLYVDKMKNVMTPMRQQPEWGTEIFDPLDSIFKSFIDSHTRNLALYKRMGLIGFAWYIKGTFQLDALLVFTAKLYKRPTGPLTDRAWTVLDSMHDLHKNLFDLSDKKVLRQAHFTLKAWTIREQTLAQCGQSVEVPNFIRRLRQLMSVSRTNSSLSGSSGSPGLATNLFMLQQMPVAQPLPFDQVDMTPYLGLGVDTSNLNVDMWGNLTMDADMTIPQQELPHGGFDLSKINFSAGNLMG